VLPGRYGCPEFISYVESRLQLDTVSTDSSCSTIEPKGLPVGYLPMQFVFDVIKPLPLRGVLVHEVYSVIWSEI
jgi:hypothetical protein